MTAFVLVENSQIDENISNNKIPLAWKNKCNFMVKKSKKRQ